MRVAVTGTGVVTPLGEDMASTWRRIYAGESAAASWQDLADYPIDVACRVTTALDDDDPLRRGSALGRRAAREAIEQAQLDDRSRVGVFVGTTMGESAGFEAAATDDTIDVAAYGGTSFGDAIAADLNLGGAIVTYGTACAAGNYAIGAARRAIGCGQVGSAIAGGVDPFSRIAMVGFARMRAMTPDLCRPFDGNRLGMQLGEGAGFLVLETEARARARGATILAYVTGSGFSGDAFHPTSPRPDGSGMATAMATSLVDASLEPNQIDWICAHGTGTQRSDAAEALAIRTVFGHRPPPVGSLKGAMGHTLGAATAIEAAMSAAALTNQVIPPTANLEEIDPGLEIDVVDTATSSPLKRIMSCGYGFGGVNSAIVMEAA